MPDIIDRLIAMELQIEELKRRQEVGMRVGTITEVNAERGLAKVDVGTPDNPLVSSWLPWTERAGGISTWTPPSPGEQVRLISPAGDMAQGWIDQGGFSNENPQSHNKANERRMKVGDTTITETGSKVLIETPELRIKADTIDLEASTIALVGKVKLGSRDASRKASGIGHLDTDGDKLTQGANDVLIP